MALGLGMPVAECQRRVSSREFAEWIAFYSIDPWGEERADCRNALLCSLVANLFRGEKEKAFTVEDFMLFGEPRPIETSEAKVERMTREIMVNFGHPSMCGGADLLEVIKTWKSGDAPHPALTPSYLDEIARSESLDPKLRSKARALHGMVVWNKLNGQLERSTRRSR